jgi:hypothetical protein
MIASLVLVLVACTAEPRIEGRVLDIWDNPVEGATVVMEGVPERPLTDSSGRFSLPAVTGPHKIKAGREGFIQEHQDVDLAEGAPPPKDVLFRLYPKPEEAGFYVIGNDAYVRVEPQAVLQFGSDLQVIHGVHEVGETTIEGSKLRVLFHTPLKLDQVMRLGLQLHRLEYTREARMVGTIDMQDVAVNLWTAAEDVPTEVSPLRSKNDYLIESKDPVAPGAYAFDTQDLLDNKDAEAFKEIPEPLRVAYAMQLR